MLRLGVGLPCFSWSLAVLIYIFSINVVNAAESLFSDGEVLSQSADAALVGWSSSYNNSSSSILRNVTLDMNVDQQQSIDPNTVVAPIGWSVEYSNDKGNTYSPKALSNTNALRFFNSTVLPEDQGMGALVSLPLLKSIDLQGGGDGFVPILLGDGRIMGINHHQPNPNIWCYDLNLERNCSGYPRSLGSAPNGGSPMSALIETKLYFGDDSGGSEYGQLGKIYCWDTVTHRSCGVSPVVEGGGYAGPVEVDNKLYVLTRNHKIDCYDPQNNLKRCSGFSPVSIGVRALANKAWWNFGADLLVHEQRIYVTSTEGKLGCFDTTTKRRCADWSTNPISTQLGYGNVFKRMNSDGKVIGLCTAGYRSNALCYDLLGKNKHTIDLKDTHRVRPGVNTQYEAYYGTRVVFPMFYPENGLACWDWATNAPCKGSDISNGFMGVGQAGSPYGVVSDGACMFSFGDQGKLMSWDPSTGETPCTKVAASVSLSLNKSTCISGNSYTWKAARIFDTNLVKNTEFKSFKVRLVDPNTKEILTDFVEFIGTKGTWNLSSISSSVRELELHAEAIPVGKVAWQDNVMPKVGLTVASLYPTQFCFQSSMSCASSTVASSQIQSSTNLSQQSDLNVCNTAPTLSVASTIEYVAGQNKTVVDVNVQDDQDQEGNGITYALSGGQASLFTINAQGHIRFKNIPVKTTNASYSVTISANDSQGAQATKNVLIQVVSDLDGDGIKDSADGDMDGDGIPNDQEGDGDLDGDGIPSSIDPHEIPTTYLGIRVFLQAAYDPSTGLMRDNLRTMGAIPTTQPYDAQPFFYNGQETLSAELMEKTGEEAVVDWVLVELRDPNNPQTLVASRAYPLLRNGKVVDSETGDWRLKVESVPAGDYYLVIRHRNHMDLVSEAPLAFSSTLLPYDFSDLNVPIYGGENTRTQVDGKGLLWAGDVNGDGRHIYTGRGNDTSAIFYSIITYKENNHGQSNYVVTGYFSSDVNMDGRVVYSGTGNDMYLLISNILHHPDNTNSSANFIPTSSLKRLLDLSETRDE